MITSSRQAQTVVADGDADVVLLARAALRDSAWPQRAAAELGIEWQAAGYPAPYTRGHWEESPLAS